MGIFEGVRLRRELKKIERKAEIAENKLVLESYNNLIKSLERSRPIIDDLDRNIWTMSGQAGQGDNQIDMYDHYEMLDQVYKFWMSNLYARAIVRNLSKFVLGRGPTVKSKDKNKEVLKSWNKFVKTNKWQLKEKEIVKRVFRDGEIFIRKFNGGEGDTLRIRFIRANNIKNPQDEAKMNSGEMVSFGIGTNSDDIEDIKTYYHCYKNQSGDEVVNKIPADQIIHIKILADSDVKRGVSFLLIALGMIKKYADWLDDRIALNKIRSAIALIKKVSGNAATVTSIRDNQRAENQDTDRNKQKAFPRATILTASKGVEYDMLSPKINAPDVKDDGRAMLLAVAAGMGMPEMMLTADFSNANYSSSMVAQNPFVREIEDWQDFFLYYYQEIFAAVIAHDIEYNKLTEDTNDECTVEFPPLILADIEKNNKAREIQHKYKIISKKTWMLKEGLDPEEERRNIEEEQDLDIYKTPFNLPQAPINQFGADFEDEENEN